MTSLSNISLFGFQARRSGLNGLRVDLRAEMLDYFFELKEMLEAPGKGLRWRGEKLKEEAFVGVDKREVRGLVQPAEAFKIPASRIAEENPELVVGEGLSRNELVKLVEPSKGWREQTGKQVFWGNRAWFEELKQWEHTPKNEARGKITLNARGVAWKELLVRTVRGAEVRFELPWCELAAYRGLLADRSEERRRWMEQAQALDPDGFAAMLLEGLPAKGPPPISLLEAVSSQQIAQLMGEGGPETRRKLVRRVRHRDGVELPTKRRGR